MFRSLIHLECIFVYGVRKCSSFILLKVVDQFSQNHLWKRLSFLHCILLPPLSKIRCPYVYGFISGLSILFHWSIFLCASTILSWWLWLCSRAWSQAGWFLQFYSSFSRLLWLFEVFCISIQIVKLFVLVLWKISSWYWYLKQILIQTESVVSSHSVVVYIMIPLTHKVVYHLIKKPVNMFLHMAKGTL